MAQDRGFGHHGFVGDITAGMKKSMSPFTIASELSSLLSFFGVASTMFLLVIKLCNFFPEA
jgi:hypothetical protein